MTPLVGISPSSIVRRCALPREAATSLAPHTPSFERATIDSTTMLSMTHSNALRCERSRVTAIERTRANPGSDGSYSRVKRPSRFIRSPLGRGVRARDRAPNEKKSTPLTINYVYPKQRQSDRGDAGEQETVRENRSTFDKVNANI